MDELLFVKGETINS